MEVKYKNYGFQSAHAFGMAPIAGLQRTLAQQAQLLREIQLILPKPLAGHVIHCVLHAKQVTLFTDSASWASQLRFYQAAILQVCTPLAGSAMKLRIKLLHREYRPPNQRKPRLPSLTTVHTLQSLVKTTDDELSQSLARLAQTLSQKLERNT